MIEGLTIIPDFITPEEEGALLALADGGVWKSRPHMDKQEQVFYAPDYRKGAEIPASSRFLSDRMGLRNPYRLILSEYKPGQGMQTHFDAREKFPIVGCIVSLISGSEWVFSRGAVMVPVHVPRRSLLTFGGDARYMWQHEVRGIKARRVSYYFSFKETE